MVVKEINEIASRFRQATAYPAVSDGRLHDNGSTWTIHSKWSQRDIDRKEKVTLKRSHVIDLSQGSVLSQSDPQEVSNEVWSVPSPSGKFKAVVKSGKDKKNEDKQYLEIYDNTKKLKTIDILALEKHGKIVGDDGQFGGFEWSAKEDRILYMAEKKKPKTAGFFDAKRKKGEGDGNKEDDEEVQKGLENEYRESWGEQLVERHHPVICIIDVNTAVITLLENVADSVSSGQAMWAPNDAGVVFCSWDHEPFRLGLKHCCQRKSGLFYYDLEKGSIELLSAKDRAVRFPRFSPDMNSLVYFDTPVGGAHHQCARLLMIDWASRNTKVVIDIVRHAPATSFQGIFIAALPRNIWFEDNVHLAFSTAWRSSTNAIIVNTDTGDIKTHSGMSNLTVLSVNKKCVLYSSSLITCPSHLVLSQLVDVSNLETAKWIFPDGTPEHVDWLSSYKVLTHKPTDARVSPVNANLDYESILCMPKETKDGSLPPLIVFSHGGPHVAFDSSFNVLTNFYCLCGYAVVMVNYRGSWGFGQDGIESVLGAVGDVDVKDVEGAMQAVLSTGLVDSSRVFLAGGSHGGYLSTQLIGQYPNAFKAAAVRNPVINLVSMFSTSDISDWIFVEGGYPFDMTSIADEQKLPELWKRSPLSHIDKVKTPVLLMVGLEDKRVPPPQSMEYYKALKARNIPVRCLTYPSSNHSLAEVDVESDSLVNSVVWYNTYL